MSCVNLEFVPDLASMSAWCESNEMISVCGFPVGPCMCQDNQCVDGDPTLTCSDEVPFPDMSVCGNPTDACMNEQNYADCRALEGRACREIRILESCPAQFSCDDNVDKSS